MNCKVVETEARSNRPLGPVATAIALIVTCLGYILLVRPAISYLYGGNGPRVLAEWIHLDHGYPLEHYLWIADGMAWRILVVLMVLLLLAFLVVRVVFCRASVHVLWLMLFSMGLLAVMYALNPQMRVYSRHGFFHASMAYQILNGHIPPQDPLFAGHALHYPWANEFLAAQVSRVLNVSPFYGYAIINVACVGLLVCLIYKIAIVVLPDRRAGIFASFIAVFGTTPFTRGMLFAIARHLHLGYFGGGPPFNKFTNINAVPIGHVFFFCSLYFLIKLFTAKRRAGWACLLFIAAVGCGFFYLAFLPVLVGAVILVLIARIMVRGNSTWGPPYAAITASVIAIGLACVCIGPYVLSTTSGMSRHASYFGLVPTLQNGFKLMIVMAPLVVVILVSGRRLLERANPRALAVLVATILAAIGGYCVVHFSNGVEYKFLLLAMASLGILGGMAFSCLSERVPRGVLVLLLAPFSLHTADLIWNRLHAWGNEPLQFFKTTPEFVETGTNLIHVDAELREFDEWVRSSTPIDSVFIDTNWDIPVYGRRPLFIALAPSGSRPRGYGLSCKELMFIGGYDSVLHAERERLVQHVYGDDTSMDRLEVLDLLRRHKIYVVARRADLRSNFNTQGLTKVYESPEGQIAVFLAQVGQQQP